MVGEGRRDCHVERKVRRGFLFLLEVRRGATLSRCAWQGRAKRNSNSVHSVFVCIHDSGRACCMQVRTQVYLSV